MRAEPQKESGLHVIETLSVRSRLTRADPAAWWKFTSLCLVGLCRPPCGALQVTCFIQLRPLRTTTSPVMVLMFRPAGITGVYGSVCAHTCRMKHDYIPHVGGGGTPHNPDQSATLTWAIRDWRLFEQTRPHYHSIKHLNGWFQLIIKANSLTSQEMSSQLRQHAGSIVRELQRGAAVHLDLTWHTSD